MKKKSKFFIGLLGTLGVFILFLSFSTIVTLQPGEKGVIFKPWTTGLNKDKILSEGIHLIAPWNKIFVYDVKEQIIEFSQNSPDPIFDDLDVLDENGLTIHVEVTVRFYPEYAKIGYIYEQFGDNEQYIKKLVIPEVRATVRRIMGQYNAEQIYSTDRHEVEQKIIEETEAVLNKNYIKMTALLIRSITIPQNLIDAIETKLTKQQEALAYEYIVEKEEKEKERKIIQAQGIAEYNRIVNESMTDRVLTYEGIQATLELANSQNSKIVIIGNTDNGLPIMLSQ